MWKKSIPSERDTSSTYNDGSLEKIQFSKKQKKTKTTIIKTLTENINSRRILKADSNDFITISSKVKGIDKRNLCNDEKTTTSEEETSLWHHQKLREYQVHLQQ